MADEIVPIVIDLNQGKKLEESWLAMFGGVVKTIMNRAFGGARVPVKVKGSKSDITAFSRALGNEERYIRTAAEYGLDDPRTYKNKYKLRQSIGKFERKTGIKWPFED